MKKKLRKKEAGNKLSKSKKAKVVSYLTLETFTTVIGRIIRCMDAAHTIAIKKTCFIQVTLSKAIALVVAFTITQTLKTSTLVKLSKVNIKGKAFITIKRLIRGS
jgi:hypothetical protein